MLPENQHLPLQTNANSAVTPPKAEVEESENESDAQTTALTQAADDVITFLLEADYIVTAAKHHDNELPKDVSTVRAYAKVCGRRWTYYVLSPRILIGRAPDGSNLDSKDLIDLGPNKLVSRDHAELYYNADDERWHISTNGRNGIKVNDRLYKKGQGSILQSGDVIEVAATEMIFVSPDVEAVVHDRYTNRAKGILEPPPPQKKEEPEPNPQWNSNPHGHPQAQGFYSEPVHVSPYSQPGSNPHQLAPNPQTFARPSTPNRITDSPYLRQSTMTTPPAYHPLAHPQQPPPQTLMESREAMDWASDAAKNVKPPMSYATLIGQAILNGPGEKSSLNGIYEWIKQHFSYYRHIEQSWQNSIRHNLSLNPAFAKTNREAHEPGKGGLWLIVDSKKEEFRKNGLKMTSRGGARQSSNPSSPAPKRSPKKNSPPLAMGGLQDLATSPADVRNPFVAGSHDAHTPSRPPRSQADISQLPRLSDNPSPLPQAQPFSQTATAGSPTTLSSSAYFDNANQNYGELLTPLPRRYVPPLTAPSTAKLPSQYLPQSSPAPFWNDPGSTPARLPDTSPLKGNAHGTARPLLQSSSPPPPGGLGSPTRARGVFNDPKLTSSVSGLSNSFDKKTGNKEKDDDEGQIDLMGLAYILHPKKPSTEANIITSDHSQRSEIVWSAPPPRVES